MRPLTWTRLSL